MDLDTKNQEFYEIMGTGRQYKVPKFQRNYAWEEEQWEDLWLDLEALEADEEHYMGYLVLQKIGNKNKEFLIIDGQQRLTTITILILSVLYTINQLIENEVEVEDNNKRLESYKDRFVGFTNTITLGIEPKLILNRNNQKYFKNFLCKLKVSPPHNLSASERKLRKSFLFFIKKIEHKGLRTGHELAAFIENFIDKFSFTTITVDDNVSAYKVFETLNARGIQLSVPDLVKNYMFSRIDDEEDLHGTEIDELEEQWETILDNLGKHDFSRFIWVEWQSRKPLVQQGRLFKFIKEDVGSAKEAFSYLEVLADTSLLFAALHDDKSEYWEQDGYEGASDALRVLNYFGVRQHHSLIISVHHLFRGNPKKVTRVLRDIEVMAIRYNIICSKFPGKQEQLYNKISRKIVDGGIKNQKDIRTFLKELYPDNEQFLVDFNKKTFAKNSAKRVRLLLGRIEFFQSEGVSYNDNDLTLEHILPQNLGVHWNHIPKDATDRYVDRLGNLTILQGKKNEALGTKPFSEKKEVFIQSPFEITKHCGQYDEWNEEAIESHQQWLADIAVKCWRIEFQ